MQILYSYHHLFEPDRSYKLSILLYGMAHLETLPERHL
jgi:hypothetical protein